MIGADHSSGRLTKAVGINVNGDRINSMLNHAYAYHQHHESSMLQDRSAGRRT
ncbi:hypothetical protein EBB79_23145 (plasmid) [Parasedimentitalea marina]|uniref:Ketopantoate reductase C-terminal domain-containing protein n=1 Tax=Parasedimentitalea marina TaxID=2483033 RepID=A0A3T0N9Z0_9RHOB|nr:hypothetical protein EBB79_23145 [Parasedimentitalea marina]